MCGTCGCGSEENGVNIQKPGEILMHEHHEHEHHHHEGENNHEEEKKKEYKFSMPALIVVIVAALFIVGGDGVGNFLSNKFGISQIEARPSWQSTINIGKNTYSDNAVFGSGPNTFVKQWIVSRPAELNNSVFWNADFVSGRDCCCGSSNV